VLVLVGVALTIASALQPISPLASVSSGWLAPTTAIVAVTLSLASVASLPSRPGRAYLAASYSLIVLVAVRADHAARGYLVVVAVASLVVPVGVSLGVRLVDVPISRRGRILTSSIAGVSATLGAARTLVYDPFHDPDCRLFCSRRSPLLGSRPALAEYVGTASGLAALAACGVAITLTGRAGVRRPTHRPTFAQVGAIAVVGLSATDVVIRMTQSAGDAPETISRSLQATRAASVAICAIVLSVRATEQAILRRRLRRVATWLETDTAPTDVEQHLRRALGDEGARVAYPNESGDYMDAAGSTIRAGDGVILTELTVAGGVVAVIAHHGTSDSTNVIADHLGQRARLAIYNEGLKKQLERNVRELRDARVRFVEATTDARRRLERDLHDGAQQRILAVVYELRRSERAARRDGHVASADALLSACELADRSLAQLRHVAHGVHPHLLTSDGLETALLSLTDTSQQPMSLRVALDGVLTSDLDHNLYSIVSGIVGKSTNDGCAVIRDVEITRAGNSIHTEIRGSHIVVSDEVIDRIDAAGGHWTRRRAGVTVELPCGS
jgi:signal transduction histidine kinase